MTLENNPIVTAFKFTATAAAALYAGRFLVMLVSRANAPDVPGLDIDWSVPQNPQFMIALILVTAIASIWALKGWPKVVAAFLFVAIASERFYSWWIATNQIKVNTGLARIPQSNWLGNLLVGAGMFDLFAFLATVSLLAFAIISMWMNVRASASHRQHFQTLHP